MDLNTKNTFWELYVLGASPAPYPSLLLFVGPGRRWKAPDVEIGKVITFDSLDPRTISLVALPAAA